MARKVLIITVALFAAALLVASSRKEKEPEPVVQIVRAAVVEQIQPIELERYSTSIEPFTRVDLAFKSGGIVDKLLQVRGADGRIRDVQAGDKVSKGAVLAQVRSNDYVYSLDQAKAQRAQSEAQLQQAEAQLSEARADFNEANIEYVRARNLFESASMVKPQYDQAKGRYEAGTARVAAAEAAVRAAKDGIEKARAAANAAQLSLSDATLRAPFAGWISARNVDRGSLVGSSTLGFSMLDTHLVKAVFAVPDTRLSMIRLGHKQPVMLDALPHAFTGVITSISPQADPQSRVFKVEVTIANSNEVIRPGMIGSITLGGSSNVRSRLVVPLSAVVNAPANPKGFAVFRIIEREGKSYASAQIIEIGETFGNLIEVKRGLAAGEKIVSIGAQQVHDGQELSVVP